MKFKPGNILQEIATNELMVVRNFNDVDYEISYLTPTFDVYEKRTNKYRLEANTKYRPHWFVDSYCKLYNPTPDYYWKDEHTTYTKNDPEVHCKHCKRTFRTDPFDRFCRLCDGDF